MPANGRWDLIRRLTLILLKWRIWSAPNNASKWQMGFNSAFNPYPAKVENRVSSNNASKWQMGFNLAFNPYPAKVENMVSS
jgi:hypothetical protein